MNGMGWIQTHKWSKKLMFIEPWSYFDFITTVLSLFGMETEVWSLMLSAVVMGCSLRCYVRLTWIKYMIYNIRYLYLRNLCSRCQGIQDGVDGVNRWAKRLHLKYERLVFEYFWFIISEYGFLTYPNYIVATFSYATF